jgi:hypothetical protein
MLVRIWRAKKQILLVGILICAATMEINMEVPQRTKYKSTYDPDIPHLVTHLKEYKSTYNRDTCNPYLL